ncbi:MAG: alpha/beta fold hydrolase [Streptomycetales bacterium]
MSPIAVPTVVLAGELDIAAPPRLGRVVAEGIRAPPLNCCPEAPNQPFQEVPDQFNARVDAFWRDRTRD